MYKWYVGILDGEPLGCYWGDTEKEAILECREDLRWHGLILEYSKEIFIAERFQNAE